MSVGENRALVQRRYDEIENKHNIDAADELPTVDYVHHDPALPAEMQHTREGFKQLVAMLPSAVPDLRTHGPRLDRRRDWSPRACPTPGPAWAVYVAFEAWAIRQSGGSGLGSSPAPLH